LIYSGGRKMFCPRCGKQLADTANFCTGCGEKLNLDYQEEFERQPEEPAGDGAAWEEPAESNESAPGGDGYFDDAQEDGYYEDGIEEYYEDEPVQRSGKKKLFIILGIVLIAAIAAVLCVYFFIIKGIKSGGSLESAAEKTTTALMERSDFTAFLNKAGENGKFGITIKADNIGNLLSAYNSYLGYIQIGGEISMAADKEGNAYASVNAEALGQNINAGVYRTANGDMDIAASAPKIIKGAYGISLESLEKDFDDSVFSPDSDTYYSIDEYTYDQVKEVISAVTAAGEGLKPAELKEELKKLQADLQKNEDTKINFERTKDTVDVGDAEVKCDIYTGDIDAEKLAEIIDYTGEWLEDNEKISDYIETIAEMSGSGIPSISDMFKEAVDQIENVDLDGKLEYDIYKGYLVRCAGTIKAEGQKIKFEICYGSDPAKTDEVTASISTPDMSYDLKLDLSKADDNEISAEIESKEADIYFKFGFKYDEKDKEFEATAKNAYRDFRITGDMEVTDKEIIMGDISFHEDGDEVLALKDFTVTLSKDPEIRTLKDDFKDGYTNILKLKEDEFEDLVEEAQDAVYSIAG